MLFTVSLLQDLRRRLEVIDSTDTWPAAKACFRFNVATRPGPWSGPIGQSDLLEARRQVMNTWSAYLTSDARHHGRIPE